MLEHANTDSKHNWVNSARVYFLQSMPYRYATEPEDYSDLSSGRVLYSLAGHPAFPIRLATEIFQRCLASREKMYGQRSACCVYDPCCGAGYQLSVVGFLHRASLRAVIASDVDSRAVQQARKNLDLLSLDGLNRRIAEIRNMVDDYGKDSHKAALESAYRLRNQIEGEKVPLLPTNVFQASATDQETILRHVEAGSVDIVFTDVPYGQHSSWVDVASGESVSPIEGMLTTLLALLSPSSVVAIVSDKGQRVSHLRYERIEHFKLGKRRIEILKPA